MRAYRIFRIVLLKEASSVGRSVNLQLLWTFLCSFIGIGAIAWLNYTFLEVKDYVFLIGSFGASAVILYASPGSPFAKPRNLFGGHLISAFIGVTISILCPEPLWFSSGLAVSSAIVIMQMTKTIHPPGGATALIAIIGSEKIKSLGFFYLISPVLSGILILFLTFTLGRKFIKIK
ncbi:MAG: HPP family protein [Cytophagaceae bacterium]